MAIAGFRGNIFVKSCSFLLYLAACIVKTISRNVWGQRKLTSTHEGHLSETNALLACKDSKLTFPLCEHCIFGLTDGIDGECILSSESQSLRHKIQTTAAELGQSGCHVYPYLEGDLLRSQHTRATNYFHLLAAHRVLDIGAYSNPILEFMKHCPLQVTVIEPCGELSNVDSKPHFSGLARCKTAAKMVFHQLSLTNIKTWVHSRSLTYYDAIVCMGCDPQFGATWEDIMMFPRPFNLILESAYQLRGVYPTSNKDGCHVTHQESWNSTTRLESGLEDPFEVSWGSFAKERHLVIYSCGPRLQSASRKRKAKDLIRAICVNGRPNIGANATTRLYQAQACMSEKHIRDVAFLAVNPESREEETSMANLIETFFSNKKCKNCTSAMHSCREWWSISLGQVETYRQSIKELQAGSFLKENPWAPLSKISNIRCEISAAIPAESVTLLIEESILLYDQLLVHALKLEHNDARAELSNRFLIQACPSHLSREYIDEIAVMEPILEIGRNLEYREMGKLISFFPYRHLLTFGSVRQRAQYQKRILLDVGANTFAASPKQLMDMYGAYLPFHQVIIIEPSSTFSMAEVPLSYMETVNITHHQKYANVGIHSVTSKQFDVIAWMKVNVVKEDFFVLKFDVDSGTHGPTLEWGFLEDLVNSPEIELVDELYIEMHYLWKPHWHHGLHSGQQRYDIINQLRACGLAVHDWP